MHVCLVGPCSPVDVAGLVDEQHSRAALELPGYRGVPVSDLAKGLVLAGHRVTVVSTDPSVLGPTVAFSGPRFEIVVVKSRPRPRDYLRDWYAAERSAMADVVRDTAPDVVHAHWTYEFEMAAQDSGLPHATTAHDAPVTILRHLRDPYRAARLAVALKARPGVRRLSAVSPYMAARWHTEMRYRRPIRVVANMIPRDALAPFRDPAPHPVLLEVADSGRLKNVPGLLRAFKSVKAQRADAELRLVGPGLAVDEPLAVRARADGLADGVAFIGRLDRSDLGLEYGRAWVFVHASLEESFGLVLLEAMASGLHVIGGRSSGGVPYVLDHGRAGTLTDVSDPEALAAAMIDTLRLGPKTGPAPEILSRFSVERVTSDYLHFYESILNKGESDA